MAERIQVRRQGLTVVEGLVFTHQAGGAGNHRRYDQRLRPVNAGNGG
ncbi:hypothetical protein [Geopsychrobacter electrodiphilus]|nr:hypothetical protein [Geopsychrobacter electrodiphilus]